MNNDVVLVVVAHSDDETIGMGGTIKRHVNKGDKVIIMSMTNGVGSRENSNPNEINKRLSRFEEEDNLKKEFDYNLINDNFETTFEKIKEIINKNKKED